MEKPTLRLFIAAAFTAAFLTGCPGPQPGTDTGVPPTDAGMPDDGGPDPVDTGVPPGDGGTDSGVIPSMCDDVEYVGTECNLPEGMAYNRDGFICESFINGDLWLSDAVGATPTRVTWDDDGEFHASFEFTNANAGMSMPIGVDPLFTCGPEGRCWLNWFNPDSSYSRCRVSFSADCGDATLECWMPGSATPVTSYAVYVGE